MRRGERQLAGIKLSRLFLQHSSDRAATTGGKSIWSSRQEQREEWQNCHCWAINTCLAAFSASCSAAASRSNTQYFLSVSPDPFILHPTTRARNITLWKVKCEPFIQLWMDPEHPAPWPQDTCSVMLPLGSPFPAGQGNTAPSHRADTSLV